MIAIGGVADGIHSEGVCPRLDGGILGEGETALEDHRHKSKEGDSYGLHVLLFSF